MMSWNYCECIEIINIRGEWRQRWERASNVMTIDVLYCTDI